MTEAIDYTAKLALFVEANPDYAEMAEVMLDHLNGIAHIGAASTEDREAFFVQAISGQIEGLSSSVNEIWSSVNPLEIDLTPEMVKQGYSGATGTLQLESALASDAAHVLNVAWKHYYGNVVNEAESAEITYKMLAKRQEIVEGGLGVVVSPTGIVAMLSSVWDGIADIFGEPLGMALDAAKALYLSFTTEQSYDYLYDELQAERAKEVESNQQNAGQQSAKYRSAGLYEYAQEMEFGAPDENGNKKRLGPFLATEITGIDSTNKMVKRTLTEPKEIADTFNNEVAKNSPGYLKQLGSLLSNHYVAAPATLWASVELLAKTPVLASWASQNTLVGRATAGVVGGAGNTIAGRAASGLLGSKFISAVGGKVVTGSAVLAYPAYRAVDGIIDGDGDQVAGALGSGGGALAGLKAGAAGGTLLCGPVCGVAGGALGVLAGSLLGEKAMRAIYGSFPNIRELKEARWKEYGIDAVNDIITNIPAAEEGGVVHIRSAYLQEVANAKFALMSLLENAPKAPNDAYHAQIIAQSERMTRAAYAYVDNRIGNNYRESTLSLDIHTEIENAVTEVAIVSDQRPDEVRRNASSLESKINSYTQLRAAPAPKYPPRPADNFHPDLPAEAVVAALEGTDLAGTGVKAGDGLPTRNEASSVVRGATYDVADVSSALGGGGPLSSVASPFVNANQQTLLQ